MTQLHLSGSMPQILDKKMLRGQIEELKGKIIVQRVVNVEPPTIETSVLSNGSIRGIEVTEMLTFVGTPRTSEGLIHGKGGSTIMAGGSEVATFTGEGIGRFGSMGSSSSSSSSSWPGSVFFSTSSKGKLSFLNNLIGSFEGEFDSDGNFTHRSWEWK